MKENAKSIQKKRGQYGCFQDSSCTRLGIPSMRRSPSRGQTRSRSSRRNSRSSRLDLLSRLRHNTRESTAEHLERASRIVHPWMGSNQNTAPSDTSKPLSTVHAEKSMPIDEISVAAEPSSTPTVSHESNSESALVSPKRLM